MSGSIDHPPMQAKPSSLREWMRFSGAAVTAPLGTAAGAPATDADLQARAYDHHVDRGQNRGLSADAVRGLTLLVGLLAGVLLFAMSQPATSQALRPKGGLSITEWKAEFDYLKTVSDEIEQLQQQNGGLDDGCEAVKSSPQARARQGWASAIGLLEGRETVESHLLNPVEKWANGLDGLTAVYTKPAARDAIRAAASKILEGLTWYHKAFAGLLKELGDLKGLNCDHYPYTAREAIDDHTVAISVTNEGLYKLLNATG